MIHVKPLQDAAITHETGFPKKTTGDAKFNKAINTKNHQPIWVLPLYFLLRP